MDIWESLHVCDGCNMHDKKEIVHKKNYFIIAFYIAYVTLTSCNTAERLRCWILNYFIYIFYSECYVLNRLKLDPQLRWRAVDVNLIDRSGEIFKKKSQVQ